MILLKYYLYTTTISRVFITLSFSIFFITPRDDCSKYWLLRLRETHNVLQLPVLFFIFSFLCQLHPRLRNCKSVFLILKILQYGGSKRWVQPFQRYPCTSTRFNLNETDQAGAGDVIKSRSSDKLKTLPLQYSTYGHRTSQDGLSPPWWALAVKSHEPLNMCVVF